MTKSMIVWVDILKGTHWIAREQHLSLTKPDPFGVTAPTRPFFDRLHTVPYSSNSLSARHTIWSLAELPAPLNLQRPCVLISLGWFDDIRRMIMRHITRAYALFSGHIKSRLRCEITQKSTVFLYKGARRWQIMQIKKKYTSSVSNGNKQHAEQVTYLLCFCHVLKKV